MTESEINYDATTIEEAQEYLKFRYLQLKKFGVTVNEEIYTKDSIITLYDIDGKPSLYGSIYVLAQHRGKQVFIKRLQQFMIQILTLGECQIQGYLEKIKCEHRVIHHSLSYKCIQEYYGDKKTKRTGVPLMNHIEEGGAILHQLGASNITKNAYYLHPILQSDEEFVKNKSMDFDGINPESLILAMEYRRVANSYLSHMHQDEFVGFPCEEIRQMLIADKVQNYKDFMQYHYGRHERSAELYSYFNNWFDLLEIEYDKYVKIIM